jgi:peroxiredoxin
MAIPQSPLLKTRGRSLTHWAMTAIVLFILANSAVASAGDDENAQGLPTGRKWTAKVPEAVRRGVVAIRESILTAWVEKGWLLVRRATVDGEIEWQVVLALASDPEEPKIKVTHETGALQVRYRGYFIRESPPTDGTGFMLPLRVYRERKAADSPEWPVLELPESRIRARGFGVVARAFDSWIWAEGGWRERGPDVWIRLQHERIRDPDRGQPVKAADAPNAERPRGRPMYSEGLRATLDGVGGLFYGDRQMQDEGDLLLASRANFDTVNRILQKRNLTDTLGGDDPPALAPGEWVGEAKPVELDKLKGKVVLLDFWSAHCGISARQLSHVEELYKKFGPAGLVVIGIHDTGHDDASSQAVKNQGITFPVMIDLTKPDSNLRPGQSAPVIGETATRYATDFFPNYFLIDKSGKLSWGFSLDPPAEERIEELLK